MHLHNQIPAGPRRAAGLPFRRAGLTLAANRSQAEGIMPFVSTEWVGQVAWLRFANPGRRNALSLQLIGRLLDGFAAIAGARAVVLASAEPDPDALNATTR